MKNLKTYINELDELKEHLKTGRYRLALKRVEQLYTEYPNNIEILKLYSESLLENNRPEDSLEIADKVVALSRDSVDGFIFRSMLFVKSNNFNNALQDVDQSLEKLRYLVAKTIFEKAKLYAQKSLFRDVNKALTELASYNSNGMSKDINKFNEWLKLLKDFRSVEKNEIKENLAYWIKVLKYALAQDQHWFCLCVVDDLIKLTSTSVETKVLSIIKIDLMMHGHDVNGAKPIIERLYEEFPQDYKIKKFYEYLQSYSNENINTISLAHDDVYSPFYKFYNADINLFSFVIRDVNSHEEIQSLKSEDTVDKIMVELFIDNPDFMTKDSDLDCLLEISSGENKKQDNRFFLKLKKEWQSIKTKKYFNLSSPITLNQKFSIKLWVQDQLLCEFSYSNKSKKLPKKEQNTKRKNSKYDLKKLIGLESIKKQLDKISTQIEFNLQRESAGLKSKDPTSYHMVFTGSPGTGKTTIARMIGEMFKEKGILKSGHVVEVDRSDLVGQYIGETAQKTNQKILEAEDGILFIDEAYSLIRENNEKDFGIEAVETIMKRMDDVHNSFIVIAVGYKNKMNTFLNSNPGLKSRFNHTIHFSDYNPDQLMDILSKYFSDEQYTISEKAKQILKNHIVKEYRNKSENFGNARYVIQLANDLKSELAYNYIKKPLEDRNKKDMTSISENIVKQFLNNIEDTAEYHIDVDQDKLINNMEMLNSFVGIEEVKEAIEHLVSSVRISQLRKSKNLKVIQKNLHSVFIGNPGTGKSSVARLYSCILKNLGILERGNLVEVSRADLVAGYAGQTAIKTNQVIDEALGGTLFIDEAYSLFDENGFGFEAISTLLKRMEDDSDKFVVIIAGYYDGILKLLNSNPGLKSRFNNIINFKNYTVQELINIIENMASENGYKFEDSASELLHKYFEQNVENCGKSFGNGRFARNILFKSISYQEKRLTDNLVDNIEALQLITYNDILNSINNFRTVAQ